jgi:hypothetical protein
VKHPKACPKCQGKRQRANEKAWHERHPEYGDKKYHEVQKKQRSKLIGDRATKVLECLKVGKDFLGLTFDLESTGRFLLQFLTFIGVRQINKFWGVIF